jgi:hypothetical protein
MRSSEALLRLPGGRHDRAGYPVDSVIRDAAALMYGEPSG